MNDKRIRDNKFFPLICLDWRQRTGFSHARLSMGSGTWICQQQSPLKEELTESVAAHNFKACLPAKDG